MEFKPQAEHEWLHELRGKWEFTHDCITAPDQPPTQTTGTMTSRNVGDSWTLLECEGETPDGGSWTGLFTLGFDPEKKRFVGTFVASMMAHLWIYDGQLEPDGKRLVLDAEGPSFDGTSMAKYQDIIEKVDRDHWILRSQMLMQDGTWKQFMEGHQRRV